MTGWTWATRADVGEMFAATIPHPGGEALYSTIFGDITCAIEFFESCRFRAAQSTTGVNTVSVIRPYIRSVVHDAELYVYLAESAISDEPTAVANTTGDNDNLNRSDPIGAWFYRAP